jgi:hypothetical protein
MNVISRVKETKKKNDNNKRAMRRIKDSTDCGWCANNISANPLLSFSCRRFKRLKRVNVDSHFCLCQQALPSHLVSLRSATSSCTTRPESQRRAIMTPLTSLFVQRQRHTNTHGGWPLQATAATLTLSSSPSSFTYSIVGSFVLL